MLLPEHTTPEGTKPQQEPKPGLPLPMATGKALEGAAQQSRKVQVLPGEGWDEMETGTTGSKFTVLGST